MCLYQLPVSLRSALSILGAKLDRKRRTEAAFWLPATPGEQLDSIGYIGGRGIAGGEAALSFGSLESGRANSQQ